MNDSLRVRLIRTDDFESLWRLFHRLSIDWALGKTPTEEETRNHVRINILGESSDVRIAIAFQDNEAVGLATFAILYPSPNRKAQLFLKELFVDGAARGKGVGRAIMHFLARYALEHGCNRFDWAVDSTNPAALAFYTALGAKPLQEKLYFRLAGAELVRFAEHEEA